MYEEIFLKIGGNHNVWGITNAVLNDIIRNL